MRSNIFFNSIVRAQTYSLDAKTIVTKIRIAESLSWLSSRIRNISRRIRFKCLLKLHRTTRRTPLPRCYIPDLSKCSRFKVRAQRRWNFDARKLKNASRLEGCRWSNVTSFYASISRKRGNYSRTRRFREESVVRSRGHLADFVARRRRAPQIEPREAASSAWFTG